MARCARAKSASGIYHVMLRGINRQDIFFEEQESFDSLSSKFARTSDIHAQRILKTILSQRLQL